MNRFAVVIGLLLVFVFTASPQNAKEWVKYTSDEGRYNVVLPVLPEVTSQDSNNAGGHSLKQYIASAADGNGGLCMIGYFDHVGANFSLDKGRDGMVKQVNGTLISEETITLGGSPGRQLKLSASAGDGTEYVIRARMYDVGTRVYVLQYLSPKSIEGPAVEASAKKFLDSFAVAK